MTHHTGSDEGRLSEAERDAVARAICGEPAWGQMPDFMRAPYRQQADHIISVVLAARAAAPDALRERVEALAERWDQQFAERLIRSNATPKITYRAALDQLRAALAETDGVGPRGESSPT